jgi:hypothetical protein
MTNPERVREEAPTRAKALIVFIGSTEPLRGLSFI